MSATRMAFRTVRRGMFAGTVEAYIPDVPANPGRCTCYARIGQHGEACRQYYLEETRPATRKERAPLMRELRGIYGPIRIIRRINWRGTK